MFYQPQITLTDGFDNLAVAADTGMAPKISESVDVVATSHQCVVHQLGGSAGAFGLFEALVGIPYQTHGVPFG
jgi:hypothetical protein